MTLQTLGEIKFFDSCTRWRCGRFDDNGRRATRTILGPLCARTRWLWARASKRPRRLFGPMHNRVICVKDVCVLVRTRRLVARVCVCARAHIHGFVGPNEWRIASFA